LAGDLTKQWADFSKKAADLSPSVSNRIATPDFRWEIFLDTRKQPSYTPSRQKQYLINYQFQSRRSAPRLTMCAERTAIFKAVSMGYKPGDFLAIAIAASADNFSPCGACRQVINEFGSRMQVIFGFGGKVVVVQMADLLPYSFAL